MKIYNTLTQTKEEFAPIEAGKLKMYVCGLTTYDYSHLGHARMLVAFDVVVRYFRASGFEVTYVRNITDIDDKILARAAENNEIYTDLTARFIKAMHEDEEALAILAPDQEPRATDHIPQITAMIETLIEKEFAYRADNGDVYYAVNQFPNYGRLSKKNPEELLAGARIAIGEAKRDPRDFALWKAAADGKVGWDSPWGYGRPGWHIECSAMSCCSLGENFDIHGGGSDLMFPHHENELAQSEAANGEKFANLWMHNGPLRIDDEKMSKSLGNFFTVREVLKKYDPEVVRFFLISSHYRSPINYSELNLQQSASALVRFYTALRGLDTVDAKSIANSHYEKAFRKAMDDDFNSAEAVSVLFSLARDINKARSEDPELANQLGALLIKLGLILGILQNWPEKFLQDAGAGSDEIDRNVIDRLVAERNQARKDGNWALADQIRDQLNAFNVVVEDGAGGSTWRVEK